MLYAVWCAVIVVKGSAACRMAVSRIFRTLPLVFCYVICAFINAALLLALRPFPELYLNTYSISMPFLLAAECAAAAEIYWALTPHYPNFRAAGTALLCALIVVGAGAAWAISFLAEPAKTNTTIVRLWYGALFVQRYASAVIAVVLIGALLLFPRSTSRPMSRLAIHSAWTMTFDALTRLTGTTFVRLYGFDHPSAAAVVPMALGILAGLSWLTLGSYETVPGEQLTPEEELMENQRLGEFYVIRAAIGDAIRGFKGQQ
jgi:hypothetical protein